MALLIPPAAGQDPTKDVKSSEEASLAPYKFRRLENKDKLRLLRLRPASETQVDIDCEILEVDLPREEEEEEEDKADKNKKMKAAGKEFNKDETQPPAFNSANDMVRHLEALVKIGTDGTAVSVSPDGKDHNDDAALAKEAKEEEARVAERKRRKYEAVSWCWGKESLSETLRVHVGDDAYAFPISPNLRSALWALRKPNEVRQLWIDAICIDQKNKEERNEQVPRMDKIYGAAQNVCIWLGNATDESKMAMEFIRTRVLELWKFDELIQDREMADHWASLITLMTRPWFSRRWVVQEIVLSPRGGTIHCGRDYTTWQDFADAVSLFVEVETATHRVSDVMKLDQKFGNIPDYFGNVTSLGAALLVDATSNLFRNQNRHLHSKQERQPLSSLEYLVSRLSVFEATQPRDTIYALLAISKDTTPEASHGSPTPEEEAERALKESAMKLLTPKAFKAGFGNQQYNVDYRLPVIDVYQHFIEFALLKADKKSALDIICRPWAPTVIKRHDYPDFLNPAFTSIVEKTKKRSKDWKKEEEEERRLEAQKRKMDGEKDQETPLPSWIPSLNHAAFKMEEHPTAGLRMERQNADPLVGLPPEDTRRRNYTAAGDRSLDVEDLQLMFIKWNTLRQPNSSYPDYSMFVRGFVFDKVKTVDHLASNGNIPYKWLQVAGWNDTNEYPPEEFWRTLVADRAHGGHNPPTYFPRACKESWGYKAKTMSKSDLDCRKLIYEGRCTIVAEFLRRVQEVIWKRKLMRTEGGLLGLVRDDVNPSFKVCILYGCSVPVILEQIQKTTEQLSAELNDRYHQWYSRFERIICRWKARLRAKIRKRKKIEEDRRGNKEREESHRRILMTQRGKRHRSSWPLNREEISVAQATLPPLPSHSKRSNEDKVIAPTGDCEGTMSFEPPLSSSGRSSPEMLAPQLARNREELSTDDKIGVDMSSAKSHEEILAEGKEEHENRKKKKMLEISKLVHKAPSYYRLVGECYVHGMMNGEAIVLQNRDRKGMSDEIFELR